MHPLVSAVLLRMARLDPHWPNPRRIHHTFNVDNPCRPVEQNGVPLSLWMPPAAHLAEHPLEDRAGRRSAPTAGRAGQQIPRVMIDEGQG
jgi:hypothetical protein